MLKTRDPQHQHLVQIWDIPDGGFEHFYGEPQFVVGVFDVGKPESFKRMCEILELCVNRVGKQTTARGLVLMVLGNKIDTQPSVNVEEYSKQVHKKFDSQLSMVFCRLVSAATSEMIHESFRDLFADI